MTQPHTASTVPARRGLCVPARALVPRVGAEAVVTDSAAFGDWVPKGQLRLYTLLTCQAKQPVLGANVLHRVCRGQSPKSAASGKRSGPSCFCPSPGIGPASPPLPPGLLESGRLCLLRTPPSPSPASPRSVHVRSQAERHRAASPTHFPPTAQAPPVFSHDRIFLHLPGATIASTTPGAFPISGAPDPRPRHCRVLPRLFLCVPCPVYPRLSLSLSAQGSIFVSLRGRLSAAEASQEWRC